MSTTKRKLRVVTHHLPHRTRLRLPKAHRKSHTMSTVKERLKKVPGVQNVEVNERTGSILVHHEGNGQVLDQIGSALEEVASELLEAFVEVEEDEIPGLSIVSHMLKSHASKMDTSLAEATGNLLDLKTLVPVGLLVAAIYKGLRDRAWWGEVPAFVLFYYAYDSYMKFHGPSVRPVSAAERVETPAGTLENPVREEIKRHRSRIS